MLSFGDPSLATQVAADLTLRPQPNSKPLGYYQGAPPQTRFSAALVKPAVFGREPTCIVMSTRENRIVTVTAPLVPFRIFVGSASVSVSQGTALTPGIPYEISLPGDQGLYAVTNAPVYLRLEVQIAAAMAGDLERRM